jgi:hydroxymethylbilane synthase
LDSHVTQWLPLDVMLPAPGQGALAVQCRADDKETLSLLSALEDAPTRAAVTAERQFLLDLGGGCAVPVAAFGQCSVHSEQLPVLLKGLVASIDGMQLIKVAGEGTDPLELGNRLAQDAIVQGAGEILKRVTEN